MNKENFFLQNNWHKVNLNEICIKITDGAHHTPKYTEKGIAFISVKNIRDKKIDFKNIKYISKEAHIKLTKKCNPEYHDVLITKSGTIGRTAVIKTKQEFDLFVSVALLKPDKNKVNPFFLMYSLDNYIKSIDIQQTVKGGVIKNLHLEDLRKIEILLPPIQQQEMIVIKLEKLFTKLDAGVKSLKHTKLQLARYRQAVLKAAFEGKLTEKWRTTNLKKLVEIDSEQILISKTNKSNSSSNRRLSIISQNLGWTMMQICNISEEVKKVKPSEKPNEYFTYIDISSINKYEITKPKKILGKNAPSRARQQIKTDDVLFSTVRTYLRNIAFVKEQNNKQIASTGFCILRPNKKIIVPKFLFYYTLTNSFVNSLTRIQRGSSYPAVRYIDVLNQFVPIPTKIEQKEIAEKIEWRLTNIEKIEKYIENILLKNRILKQGILKKAFEGKLISQFDKDLELNSLTSKSKEDVQINSANADIKTKQARLEDFE